MLSYSKRHKLVPYLFVLPFILFMIVFMLYPIGKMVSMSFHEFIGFAEGSFNGIKNYKALLRERALIGSVRNTIVFALVIMVFMSTIPVLFAVLLNNPVLWLRNAYRTALFIPTLTSVIVAGIFFRFFFADAADSFLNRLLVALGGEPQKWLHSTNFNGGLAVVVTSMWRSFGIYVIYYLSGLQTIPTMLYEAAEIDGANAVDKFFRITIPSLRPVIVFVCTISLFGGLRLFGESYILWSRASHSGSIGQTIMTFIYNKCFGTFEYGIGAAVSCVFLLFVLLLNLIYVRLMNFSSED